jgi:FAD/FMN-containing dehydrogenase
VTLQKIGSWGRLDLRMRQTEALSRNALPDLMAGQTALAYGKGRSYGDSCLTKDGVLWLTAGLDRLLAFDPQTGVLRVEAGVSLAQIQDVMAPRGWALAVVPGTRFVSVGGAIANDVHGKNHHAFGSFCDHVLEIEMNRTDGDRVVCGPNLRSDWFAATAGGLGLTGVIRNAALQLRRITGPWLSKQTIPFEGLEAFFDLSDQSAEDWENAVAWIDCLSGPEPNGLFSRANPAADQSGRPSVVRRRNVPMVLPISAINQISLRAFNAAYLHKGRMKADKTERVDVTRFHHPLDTIRAWNRIYGPRGFYQYQCAIPLAAREDATRALLREIKQSGQGSFLVVLKTFGARTPVGMMSFATEGVTLALDFPNLGRHTLQLLDRLDAIVAEAKGRLYPAKDARMSPALFRAGYPRLEEFLKYRDPGLSSALSCRLIGN